MMVDAPSAWDAGRRDRRRTQRIAVEVFVDLNGMAVLGPDALPSPAVTPISAHTAPSRTVRCTVAVIPGAHDRRHFLPLLAGAGTAVHLPRHRLGDPGRGLQ